MNHRQDYSRFLVAVALALSAAASAGAAMRVQQTPATKRAALKEMSAKEEEEFAAAVEETMERACRQCHPIENVTRMRRTPREWTDLLITMQGRGASATEEEFEGIQWYLSRYYGVVRVNTATAEELSAVLGLSAKDAAAVVEHRKAHGNFTDLPALLKVDGIDKAKIEEQPEALRFN